MSAADGLDGVKVLTFRVGSRRLALDAHQVAEVVRQPRITRVPNSPAALAGVANVRGRVAPVIALARLLGEPDPGATGRLIVLAGGEPVGLAVDEVSALSAVGEVPRVDLDRLLAEPFATGPRQPIGKAAEGGRAAQVRPAVADAGPASSYLQFEVSGQSYALGLEAVREVVQLPGEVTSLPYSDRALAGVIAYRGALLPLVKLRAVLGLPDAARSAATRVVVVNVGEAVVGLVVDRIVAIFEADEASVSAVPGLLNRGAGEARVEAIVRTDAGLVALLVPEKVLDEATVLAIAAEHRGEIAEMPDHTEQATEQFLIFRLAEEAYGLPIAAVEEVLTPPGSLARAPKAPAFIAGLMTHRGEVLPIIEQRIRFDVGGAAPRRRRVIVARIGGVKAGFLVDALDGIVRIPLGQLRQTPDLASDEEGLFDRVAEIEVDGRLVLLVNPQALLDQAERDIVDALARDAAPSS